MSLRTVLQTVIEKGHKLELAFHLLRNLLQEKECVAAFPFFYENC